MSGRRIVTWLVIVICSLIIIGFLVPSETKPSETTRVILEHYEETYIAPVCFEDAEVSNNIEETTLKHAKEVNYAPDSSCTEDALKPEKNSLIISWLKNIGLLSKQWDDW